MTHRVSHLEAPRSGWNALDARLKGSVIHPGDPRMVLAGKHFAAGSPLHYPQVLIRCAAETDIVDALHTTRASGCGFSIRSGGHCFGDFSSHAQVIIDMGGMDDCRLDGDILTVSPGALSGSVARLLAGHGRCIPTGGCPFVSVSGLALVGGFGVLGRSHGLTTDHVIDMRLVLADGRVVVASPDAAADLFRGMRGGGAAGLAIVSQMRLRTLPLPSIIVCRGTWSMENADRIVKRWLAWLPASNPGISVELGFYCPDDPALDAHIELYGAIVDAGWLADARVADLQRMLGEYAADLQLWPLEGHAAAEYLCGLRAHDTSDAWLPSRPYRDVGFQFTHSAFFEQAPSSAALVDLANAFVADRIYPEAREIELVPWGGAYRRADRDTSFAHRNAQLLIRHTAMVGARSDSTLRAHAAQWAAASHATVADFSHGGVYPGYADPGLRDWPRAYYGESYPALQRLKRIYDPDDVFRHLQSVRHDPLPSATRAKIGSGTR